MSLPDHRKLIRVRVGHELNVLGRCNRKKRVNDGAHDGKQYFRSVVRKMFCGSECLKLRQIFWKLCSAKVRCGKLFGEQVTCVSQVTFAQIGIPKVCIPKVRPFKRATT